MINIKFEIIILIKNYLIIIMIRFIKRFQIKLVIDYYFHYYLHLEFIYFHFQKDKLKIVVVFDLIILN